MISYKAPVIHKISFKWNVAATNGFRDITEITNTVTVDKQILKRLPVTGPSILPIMGYVYCDTVMSSGATSAYLNLHFATATGALGALPVMQFDLGAAPWNTNGVSGIFAYPQSNVVFPFASNELKNLVIVTDVDTLASGTLYLSLWYINAGLQF